MSDRKNIHTATTGLPEKDWFTLEEIARRWGCAVDDLLHYGMSDKLTLCFRPGVHPINYVLSPCTIKDDGGFELSADKQVTVLDNSTEWANLECCITDFSLIGLSKFELLEISMHGKWEGYMLLISCIYDHFNKPMFNNKILGHEEVFTSPKSGDSFTVSAGFGDYKDGHPPMFSVSLQDILVPKEERDRFEKTYRIGAFAGTMPNLSEPTQINSYTTEYINIMQAAISEFFETRRNFDASREKVVPWIKSLMKTKGLPDSENIASAMFTIIKPPDHDPRKKRV